ncbi:MAG: hypothetical protein ACKO2K_06760 [Alphaproteobacteria bacterium]
MRAGSARRVAKTLAAVLALVAAAVVARGLERRNTWYLASDQFAFLQLAGDLREGRVLHSPDAILRLGAQPPRRGASDAYFQTYFWDGSRLWSRYPPGFPAMLAAAGAIGGEPARHLLNPALYAGLLVLLAWSAWRLLRGLDRPLAAGAALVSAWLAIVLPTQLHLWGITVARDLPANLLGLGSVLAVASGATGLAGLLLGLACTVRPDAVLWGASALALAARGRRVSLPSRAARFALAFAAGLLPLLLYNRATRGSIFGFTQAGEFDRVLSWLRLSPLGVVAQVSPSGGGFRLSHLGPTLSGNLRLLGRAFSWTGALALFGAAWSVRRRPGAVLAFAPYAVLATVFYGFWSHPDPRYLAGISLCLAALAGTGAAAACRELRTAAGSAPRAIAFALGVATVAAAAWAARAGVPRDAAWPGAPEAALAVAIAACAAWPRGEGRDRPAAWVPLLPACALAVLALSRVAGGSGGRDPFQREQVERARAAVESVVPAGALVLADDDLGRPAENITHYTHADAHYAGELPLLRTHPARAAVGYALEGRAVFALVGDEGGELASALRQVGALRVVERRRGDALLEWFVDPSAAPGGASLVSVEVSAPVLESARSLREAERRAR